MNPAVPSTFPPSTSPSIPPSSSFKPTQSSSQLKSRPLSDADAKLQAASSGGSRKTVSHGWAGWPSAAGHGISTGSSVRRDLIRKTELKWIGAVVVIALFVRLWKISQPTSVVFDEVHFGGFASKYKRQVFFMDVHPPLAKLLIAFASLLGGFDGSFDFKDIGKDYIEPGVPYVIMRLLPALMGVAVIPIAYLTLRALGTRTVTAILGSLILTFENGLVTQSRLILLDSPLIFFTTLTTLFWVKFSNENTSGVHFSIAWWTYLTLCGLSLGATASCKWVGLFTIATIGLSTIRQLWILLGNLRVSPRSWARHFAARALCLIVVPILFYMFMFQIHFWVLNRSGDGDGFMSSEFQHTLIGHGMADTYADVALGSHVSIRHVNTQGGYLHSHAHSYPGGSKQQQITLYPHRDENNVFRIVNASSEEGPVAFDWNNLPIQHVMNNMKVRLEHVTTEKRLHSHDVRPPVSEVDFQNEVSAYGFPGFGGDANDDFIVEISQETRGGLDKKRARQRLRTLRSHFRLRHVMTGCYLFSHRVKLPDWGFEQQEVTCNKNPTWDNSLWYIETNEHGALPAGADRVNYHRPGFLSKFLELQAVMWQTNAGLTDRHAYDSRPSSWPWLRRGINFWVQNHRQIYLVGNPIVWWLSSLSIASYIVARGLLILRAKRGFKDLYHPTVQHYDEMCGFLVLGWALHYLPFFLMARQLFLHHYFPALYFAVLCFCAVFDLATKNIKAWKRLQVALMVFLVVLWTFRHFAPLSYGNSWTKQECENSKWLKSWDFSCADFLDKRSDYDGFTQAAIPSAAVPASSENQAKPEEVTTTLVAQQPEAGPNFFQDNMKPKEEKTIAVIGAQEEKDVPVDASPDSIVVESTAEVAADTRAPVGRDAGAPEATFAEAVGGGSGWQGGAEDAPGVVGLDKKAETSSEPPAAVMIEKPKLELDEEAQKQVEEALARDAREDTP